MGNAVPCAGHRTIAAVVALAVEACPRDPNYVLVARGVLHWS
ncbi:hypothetical protein ACFPRL_36090 [Pseudoclavibacter helvolus]